MRHLLILTLAIGGALAVAACTPSTTVSPTGAPITVGPATSSTPGATAPAVSGAAGIALEVRDFALDPGALSVPAGSVTLAVTNEGPTVHNVKVRDGAGELLFGTADLREGESESITGNLEPGDYVMFCSLAGHESLGIKGTLTVTAP